MSYLDSLQLAAVQKPRNVAPIVHKRNKLIAKLHEQAEAVRARLQGEQYFARSSRLIRNRDTGESKAVEQVRAVKPWYWTGDNGTIFVQVRYGTKVLELSKGKPSIVVPSLVDVPKVFEGLKRAVEAGELDSQLEAVSASVSGRFKQPAKKR